MVPLSFRTLMSTLVACHTPHPPKKQTGVAPQPNRSAMCSAQTVVAEHDVPAPVISQAWQACMAPIFKYMAETKRLFGVHCDIVPWKVGNQPQQWAACTPSVRAIMYLWDSSLSVVCCNALAGLPN